MALPLFPAALLRHPAVLLFSWFLPLPLYLALSRTYQMTPQGGQTPGTPTTPPPPLGGLRPTVSCQRCRLQESMGVEDARRSMGIKGARRKSLGRYGEPVMDQRLALGACTPEVAPPQANVPQNPPPPLSPLPEIPPPKLPPPPPPRGLRLTVSGGGGSWLPEPSSRPPPPPRLPPLMARGYRAGMH